MLLATRMAALQVEQGVDPNSILECRFFFKTEHNANQDHMMLTLTQQNPWQNPSTMLLKRGLLICAPMSMEKARS
jgi:hypothetical protein